MSDIMKIALLAMASVAAMFSAYIYFSPYQSCVRGQEVLNEYRGVGKPWSLAKVTCARIMAKND